MIPTQFLPTFPCFSVFADDCQRPYIVGTPSAMALLVLTDEDQLERFRRTSEAVGPTIRFDVPGQLVLYLDALPPNITHVAFDPSVIDRAVVVSARELVKRVLESLG